LLISILLVLFLIIFAYYSKSDVTPDDGSVWINEARLPSVSQQQWIVTRQYLWSWSASSNAFMPGSSLRKESSSLHELTWPPTYRGLLGRVGAGIDSRWCHLIFQWHIPSDRTTALGTTQPLVKMSTRNTFWG